VALGECGAGKTDAKLREMKPRCASVWVDFTPRASKENEDKAEDEA
jgi:hypothetical protein